MEMLLKGELLWSTLTFGRQKIPYCQEKEALGVNRRNRGKYCNLYKVYWLQMLFFVFPQYVSRHGSLVLVVV